jgi:hypothetical protein
LYLEKPSTTNTISRYATANANAKQIIEKSDNLKSNAIQLSDIMFEEDLSRIKPELLSPDKKSISISKIISADNTVNLNDSAMTAEEEVKAEDHDIALEAKRLRKIVDKELSSYFVGGKQLHRQNF